MISMICLLYVCKPDATQRGYYHDNSGKRVIEFY